MEGPASTVRRSSQGSVLASEPDQFCKSSPGVRKSGGTLSGFTTPRLPCRKLRTPA
jgi:hypothetical protein